MAQNNSNFRQNARLVSPKGVFIYPHFNTPDQYQDNAPVYKTVLRVNADAAKQEIERIVQLRTEWADQQRAAIADNTTLTPAQKQKKLKGLDKIANEPWVDSLDEETGEKTGEVDFKFKINATGKMRDGSEYSNKPKFFDAKGAGPFPNILVYNNASGKITYAASFYLSDALGLTTTLKPLAVQVIDASPAQKGGAAKTAADYGFGSEEGDFDADRFVKNTDAEAAEAEGEAGDDEGGIL